MLELVPGTDVWVYPKTIRVAIKKAEKSTTKCARYLMSCFYTTSELVKAGNVTGKNGKPGLDERIREAIISKCIPLISLSTVTVINDPLLSLKQCQHGIYSTSLTVYKLCKLIIGSLRRKACSKEAISKRQKTK